MAPLHSLLHPENFYLSRLGVAKVTVMRHMKLKYFEVPSYLDIDTYTMSCTGSEYVLAYVAGYHCPSGPIRVAVCLHGRKGFKPRLSNIHHLYHDQGPYSRSGQPVPKQAACCS